MATAKSEPTPEPTTEPLPEIPDSSQTCGQFPADEVAATFKQAEPKAT